MTFAAKYEKGVFRPLQDIHMKEGTIVEVYTRPEALPRKTKSIGDLAFAGMWKGRDDMADSVEYINRLRHELHG